MCHKACCDTQRVRSASVEACVFLSMLHPSPCPPAEMGSIKRLRDWEMGVGGWFGGGPFLDGRNRVDQAWEWAGSAEQASVISKSLPGLGLEPAI